MVIGVEGKSVSNVFGESKKVTDLLRSFSKSKRNGAAAIEMKWRRLSESGNQTDCVCDGRRRIRGGR